MSTHPTSMHSAIALCGRIEQAVALAEPEPTDTGLKVGDRVRVAYDVFPVYIGEYGTITRAFERRHGSGGRLIPATSHNLEVTFDLPANGFSGRWYRPEDVERIV